MGRNWKMRVVKKKKIVPILAMLCLLSVGLPGCGSVSSENPEALSVKGNTEQMPESIDGEEQISGNTDRENQISENAATQRQVSDRADEEVTEKGAPEEMAAVDFDSLEDWRKCYIRYLQDASLDMYNDGFQIIYLDDDEIPELVEIGNCEAVGCRIVNYHEGEVYTTQLDRLEFTYLERENLLCNSSGLMGYYYDLVYSLVDGRMTLVAEGYYQEARTKEDDGWLFDENGNVIYEYEWNGVKMPEEEYRRHLEEIYGREGEKAYTTMDWYTRDMLIRIFEAGEMLPTLKMEEKPYYGTYEICAYLDYGNLSAEERKAAEEAVGTALTYGRDILTIGDEQIDVWWYDEEDLDWMYDRLQPYIEEGLVNGRPDFTECVNAAFGLGTYFFVLDENSIVIWEDKIFYYARRR